MINFRFKTYLTSNIDIKESLLQEILTNCHCADIKKDEFLLSQGENSHQSYFVQNGLLRQYSIDSKGKEHILQFAPENWFLSNRESEYLHLPSSYFIQALEDSQIFILEKELFLQLAHNNAQFAEFNLQLLHKHIASLQKRITQLQSYSAKERYLDFIKTYPDLMLRVPQIYVASYLGITPESLSRVRKQLSKE